MPKGLTPKQRKFIKAYAKSGNATRSAIEAGYSENGAGQTAHNLLKKTEIQAAMTEMANAAGLETVKVLEEIRRLAFSDFTDAFNDDGTLKPLKEIPEDARRAIAGIEVTEHMAQQIDGSSGVVRRTSKLKIWDKPATLGLAAKVLGIAGPDKQETHNTQVVVVIREDP